MTKHHGKADTPDQAEAPDPRLGRAARALEQARERMQAQARELAEAEARAEALALRLDEAAELQARLERQLKEAEERTAEAVRTKAAAEEDTQAKFEAERQRQRLAHAERDLLFAAFLSATPDAVAALDATGRFVSWNGRFPALFALSPEAMTQGLRAVAPAMAGALREPDPFLRRLEELLAQPEENESGLEIATSAGHSLLFRSIAPRAQTSDGASVSGRVLLVRDITLERDLEGLVREIEGLTRYELGPTLAGFVHLPGELLDDPDTPDTMRPRLSAIRNAGLTLAGTVNMAFDLFRMERGLYRVPADRRLDLAQALRRAARDLAPLAASRSVTLALLAPTANGQNEALAPEAVLAGPGDPALAHALAAMLLRDALETCPPEGQVTALLLEDDIDQCLRLDLHRPGVMGTEEAAQYFDKPRQRLADEGLRRNRYAARLIAKTLGGGLTLLSSPHDGTTLTLRLPKA